MVEYSELVFNRHAELFSEIKQFTDLVGKKVLDFGCGNGAGTVFFSLQGIDVVGIDNNQPGEDNIAKARKYALHKGSKAVFKYMDGEKMDFPRESIEAVLAVDVWEHLANPYGVLQEIERVLCPRGLLIIVWQPYYSPYGGHLRYYSKNPWRQLMPFFDKDKYLKKACQRNPINPYEHELAVLNSLNKLTLRKFKKMVRLPSIRFDFKVVKKLPFKTDKAVSGLGIEKIIKGILNKVPMLSIIEEFTVPSVLIILEKNDKR
jgi:SAM-dependent methyltransferase